MTGKRQIPNWRWIDICNGGSVFDYVIVPGLGIGTGICLGLRLLLGRVAAGLSGAIFYLFVYTHRAFYFFERHDLDLSYRIWDRRQIVEWGSLCVSNQLMELNVR